MRLCIFTRIIVVIISWYAAAAAKLLQSCLTLCNPIDGSPSGSAVPGIHQARTLEWVAISFSNAWKWNRSVVSDSLRSHGLQPTRLLCTWDFPGKSTGVGCHCLLRNVWQKSAKLSGFIIFFEERSLKITNLISLLGIRLLLISTFLGLIAFL